MSTRREFLGAAAATALLKHANTSAFASVRTAPAMELWYEQPARDWLEALPLGNGNQGAMIFGGVQQERIALSDSTAWSGAPGEHEVNPEAHAHIDEIRQLIFAGKYVEATKVARRYLPGRSKNFGTNLPLPDLLLQFDAVTDEVGYRRTLDLETAIATVSFQAGGKRYLREAFATHAHRVIVYHVAHPASFQVRFASSQLPSTVTAEGNRLVLRGRALEHMHSDGKSGVALEIHVEVLQQGGNVDASAGTLRVAGSMAATVLVAVGTSFNGKDPAATCDAALKGARRALCANARGTRLGLCATVPAHVLAVRER